MCWRWWSIQLKSRAHSYTYCRQFSYTCYLFTITMLYKLIASLWLLYEYIIKGYIQAPLIRNVHFVIEYWVLPGRKRSWSNSNCNWCSEEVEGGYFNSFPADSFFHYGGFSFLVNLSPPYESLSFLLVGWNGILNSIKDIKIWTKKWVSFEGVWKIF